MNRKPHNRRSDRKRTRDPRTEISAAVVMLHKPGAMNEQGRREISQWLRRTADALVEEGAQYNDSGRFVARYLFEPAKIKKLLGVES